MKHAVYGIVQTRAQAESIVSGLRSAGFTGHDISVLFPDKGGTQDFAHEKSGGHGRHGSERARGLI